MRLRNLYVQHLWLHPSGIVFWQSGELALGMATTLICQDVRRRRYWPVRVTASASCTQTKGAENGGEKQTDQKIISWVVGLPVAIIAISEPIDSGGVGSRQSQCWRSYCSLTACSTNYPELKSQKGDLAMKIHVNASAELVTVHSAEPIQLGMVAGCASWTTAGFDKSVKAASSCGFSTKRMKVD